MTTTALASREPGHDGADLPTDVQALMALLAQRAAEQVNAARAVWWMVTAQSTEHRAGGAG